MKDFPCGVLNSDLLALYILSRGTSAGSSLHGQVTVRARLWSVQYQMWQCSLLTMGVTPLPYLRSRYYNTFANIYHQNLSFFPSPDLYLACPLEPRGPSQVRCICPNCLSLLPIQHCNLISIPVSE